MKTLRQTGIFYGWFIIGASFLIMAIGFGSVYNASSIFIQPVCQDLGFTRSQFNLTMTIRAVVSVVVSLLAGKIFRRFPIMRVMKTAAVILILSFFTYSLADSLSMFYLISVAVSIAQTLVTIIPLSIIISNWFDQGRGAALGLAFMGSGVGGMVLSSLTGIWIQMYGWRAAYQILTVLMVIFLIPSVFLVLRLHPRELGLNPHGVTREGAERFRTSEQEGITLRQAMRSASFWGINLASVLLVVAVNGLMLNVAPHLTDIGYSITFSANMVALIMGSLAMGKFILGKLFDRLGLKPAILIASCANIIALAGLIYAEKYIGLAVTVLFAGVGCAYSTITYSVLTLELYGKKDYRAILGFITAIASLGGIISPVLTGFLYDLTGSYLDSYKISIGFCVIALAIFLMVFGQKKQQKTMPSFQEGERWILTSQSK
ncbi:MFS transporter [Proteiniclasticum sp. QWL-01]|uniref:MFS transporter n=1 Tax=Proteiniclasticum sp. QWL-01 TaxID=3036945 RepID=UPI00241040D0|nr:MFS transporter [Proteiniclasticum sp. QWL-01]WFF72705.1 MFS transporter [Proteiniclasticum sp. QWL-01]